MSFGYEDFPEEDSECGDYPDSSEEDSESDEDMECDDETY